MQVYVRLWFRVGRSWGYFDFAYRRTAAPAPHEELTSATATFQWPGAGISSWVYVGSLPGVKDMANSGALHSPSWTVNNLPTDGRLIHVRKWTQASNGQWTYTDNVYATVAIGFEAEEEERNEFDLDDDGIRNEADPDLDGDGVSNASDPDIDGDGLNNEIDSDDDGDGVPDNEDPEPNGPTPGTHHKVSVNCGLYGGNPNLEIRDVGDAFVWSIDRQWYGSVELMLKKGARYYARLSAGPDSGARITVDLKGGPWVTSEDGPNVLTNSLSVREFESKELNFLPVSVVELAPKVKDSNGMDIEGSERPNVGNPLTPLVEVNPYTSKIAHRELKVSFDESLNGKTVTWFLEMLPGATPAMIRGQWLNGRKRFQESTTYGRHGFSGITTKIVNGHSAIRVNVPPIGLNQARVKIRVAALHANRTIYLLDMEVPAVVVIDPGHGGTDSGVVGRTDRTIEESDLALAYGLDLNRDTIATREWEVLRSVSLCLACLSDCVIERSSPWIVQCSDRSVRWSVS